MLLIFYSVKPSYEASSLLQIEPAQDDIFGPYCTEMWRLIEAMYLPPDPGQCDYEQSSTRDGHRQSLGSSIYRQLRNGKILGTISVRGSGFMLLAIPTSFGLLWNSAIRHEAVAIVKAVVQAYLAQTVDFDQFRQSDANGKL